MISPMAEKYDSENYDPYKYQNPLYPYRTWTKTETNLELYKRKHGINAA